MQDEFKDRRLKYVDIARFFHSGASEIIISSKQHLRACEKLAAHLASQRPKDAKEFEQVEWLKDFVLKSADLNEKTIHLLDSLKTEVQQIADDAEALTKDAKILDRLRDQEETIAVAWHIRDKAINDLYELRKADIRKNQAAS